jgi:hypothetical protein
MAVMYILLRQVPLETVLYCTVISSFISIPQLGLKVLCEWIMVLLWSMINIFEKLIVWEIKLINYQFIERLETSKINEPPFDPKEMGHWLVKHLDTQ